MKKQTKCDKIDSVKNKLKVIFSSVLILCAVVVSAIVFFVPLNKDHGTESEANNVKVVSQDINIVKGEKAENFYSVNKSNAVVYFVIENETLIKIDGDDLIGLKQGETKVTIIAKADESETSCTIEVKISDNKKCEIKAKENCTIEDNKILASANAFSISVNFYDNYGKTIVCDYEVSSSVASTKFLKRMDELVIKGSQDFDLTLTFDEDTSITLQVSFI